MKLERDDKKSNSRSSLQLPKMSFRCWGLKPSGPPAEPAGKEKTALRTMDGVMLRWKSVVAGWNGGMSVSGRESGCLFFSFCRFSGLSATRVVEGEEANLTAQRKSTSSSLEYTLAANDF